MKKTTLMKKVTEALVLLLPVILCLCVFAPLLLLLEGSFMSKQDIYRMLAPLGGGEGFARWEILPRFPTLRGYVELLLDRPQFFAMFWNSIAMVFGSLIGQLVMAMPAAWWFARSKSRFSRRLFTLYVVLMLMPFQVTMVSSYLVLDGTNLLDSYWSIILPAAFSTFPVFIMYRFFKSIPQAVIEAAQIDGANNFSLFLHIGMPLGSAGVAATMVLGFLEYWNLIEQPLTFLKDQTLWPLSLYLPQISWDQAGVALAASVVALLPSLLVFLYGQSYLEQGILASALKE